MKEQVSVYIVELLEKKKPLPDGTVISEYPYIDVGHIDSLSLMKFILEIEENFDIEIEDQDIQSDAFRTVGGLIDIVAAKAAKSTT